MVLDELGSSGYDVPANGRYPLASEDSSRVGEENLQSRCANTRHEAEMSNEMLQTDSQDTTVDQGKNTTCEIEEQGDQPIAMHAEVDDQLIHPEVGDQPMSAEVHDQLIHAEAGDQPISAEVHDQLIHAEVGDQPMSAEVHDQLMHAKADDELMHAEVDDQLMHAEADDELMHAEVDDQLMHAKADDEPMHAKADDEPMHAEADDRLIHDEADNHEAIVQLKAEACKAEAKIRVSKLYVMHTDDLSSSHSNSEVSSMHGSLDPVEEEGCLLEHHEWKHCTEPNSNQTIFSNLHENAIMYTQTDRGDKQPGTNKFNIGSSSFSSLKRPVTSSNPLRSFASTDDGTSFNEATVGLSSSGYCTGRSDYSEFSFKARIVGGGSSKGVNLAGVYSETDKAPCRKVDYKEKFGNSSLIEVTDVDAHSKHSDLSTQSKQLYSNHMLDRHTHIPNGLLPTAQRTHQYIENQPTAVETAVNKVPPTTNKTNGYSKSNYAVLVGNCVKVYSTTLFASLPHHNKFMVKERLKDKVKLRLKSSMSELKQPGYTEYDKDDKDDVVKDGAGDNCSVVKHFRENAKRSGYIIYTCDGNFHGNIKYPLPNGKATDSRIGKGGNGFVFTIYHEKRVYAVKKTVYRPNEVNVHSSLKHKNILPLLAVMVGEKHERHSGKFYCFHFMPKMDYDLRQILSTKEIGCLKHYYNHCVKDHEKWQTGFMNIKFILGEILKALAYLHENGYVHRDVKASNIMVKMACQCRPINCKCNSKYQVKLGDFDSAGTVPGLGITEPTDQIIKFASILPLGTPGYRAPEVSMHVTLSGPYETLYTTAVDMWSFGCLCLNICIGKTAALKQREEASLLLSRNSLHFKELWQKTTKIQDLEAATPFSTEKLFTNFIKCCLQVDSDKRPSAKDAIKVFHEILSLQPKQLYSYS